MSPVSYPAEVQAGSAITYGDGKVWGIFPDPSDSLWSYFECYDPNAQDGPDWEYLSEEFFITNSAITYQWRSGGKVLVVGNEFGEENNSILYCYDVADSSWEEEEIDEFDLGPGASIAFRPAPGYYGTYVAGWMYCLVGGGQEFWCYSLPGHWDVMVDGICPGETALVADQTPLFIWGAVQGAEKYRLTISPNSDMSDPVLVDSVNDATYQVTDSLSNDVYYWQSESRQGACWTASSVHSFVLEGGWYQLEDIPASVSYGGALAYEKNFYSGEERLLALVGGGSWSYYTYSVAGNTWYEFTTPKAQEVGTAIVTHEAASSTPPGWLGPWVVFGEYTDSLYYHNNAKPAWIVYGPAGEFPQALGPGASLAYSIESGTPYLYLTLGEDGNGPRNDFYRQELPTSGGGGQAGIGRPASGPARLIGSPGEVTVEYQLSAPTRVKAIVFDAVGRQIGVLHDGPQPAGTHSLRWDTETSARGTSAGAYFVLLDMGTEQARLKAVVR